MTYGFIGTGNMGGALARALVKTVSPTDIFLNNRTMATITPDTRSFVNWRPE